MATTLQQIEDMHPDEKVVAHNVDIENEHESDMPVPVPEGPMPSHIPSDHDHGVSENHCEPKNSDTNNYTGHAMDPDEGEIADMFLDDNNDMGDIEEDLMMSALSAAGTDRHSAQIFTNRAFALKAGPAFLEVYGRGHIMADANGPRRALNVHGIDALDLRTFKKNGDPWNFDLRQDREKALQHIDDTSRHG